MLGPAFLDPTTGKTFRHTSMLELVKDWTGGCKASPGNNDIIAPLIQTGVLTPKNLFALAHQIRNTVETYGDEVGLNEAALATVINECLIPRVVRARLIRHAWKYHGVRRRVAKEDLVVLREETRSIMKTAGLQPSGES